jgi:hypothetical protein
MYFVFVVLGGFLTLGPMMMAFMEGYLNARLLFFFLIGVLFLYYSTVLQSRRKSRKCPQCAEVIKKDALKCRFCGSEQIPDFS